MLLSCPSVLAFYFDVCVCSLFFLFLSLPAALYTCIDAHNTILDKYHYMLYYLAPAMVCFFCYVWNPAIWSMCSLNMRFYAS